MDNLTFLSFISLEYETEPPSSLEEGADLMYSEPRRPQQAIETMIPLHEVEEISRHNIFKDLTQLRTYGQRIYIVDEHIKEFKKSILDLTGQQPRQTWEDHVSKDGLSRIRTFHN